MQLRELTVDNVGVFRGRHDFDLRPVKLADGDVKNLTVVTGQNGAGKSTLFKALGLALHGSLYLGSRTTHQGYNDYLFNRLHRVDDSDFSTTAEEGGVSLSFGYVRSGKPTVVEVERRWFRKGKNVTESLRVLRDGETPDVNSSDYQTYLNDLVSPGVSPLCFFDAELLNALTLPEKKGGALLGSTLRGLLGLDIVGRLQADLTQYTTQRGSGPKIKKLRRQLIDHQKSLEGVDALLQRLDDRVESAEADKAELETSLQVEEQRLASEGGSYAARRPVLLERQASIGEEIERVSEQLRELSGGLLPFALVPGFCQTLAEKLSHEAEMHRRQIANDLVRERVSVLESALSSDEAWREIDIDEDLRAKIVGRLTSTLKDTEQVGDVGEQRIVHRLAEPEHDRLRDWISQSLRSVPEQTKQLGGRLKELKSERRRIDVDLQRAPEDEALAAMHEKISRIQSELASVMSTLKELTEKQGALRYQREEVARQLRRADEELRQSQAGQRQTDLAERSKLVLKSYQDAMTKQRLVALESSLVKSFNAVSHKELLLRSARIDPETFEVRLEGLKGRRLDVQDFSAGEQQLYALALLRALRTVSKRSLPLAVDTPVARLDEANRDSFIDEYVPNVSDQVILFATDVEMGEKTLELSRPHLARVYRLDHDEAAGETFVTRTEMTPSANGRWTPVSIGPGLLGGPDGDL